MPQQLGADPVFAPSERLYRAFSEAAVSHGGRPGEDAVRVEAISAAQSPPRGLSCDREAYWHGPRELAARFDFAAPCVAHLTVADVLAVRYVCHSSTGAATGACFIDHTPDAGGANYGHTEVLAAPPGCVERAHCFEDGCPKSLRNAWRQRIADAFVVMPQRYERTTPT